MTKVSSISAFSDAEAAAMVSGSALAEMAARITSTPAPAAPARRRAAGGRQVAGGRQLAVRPRHWFTGITVAAGLAVVVLIATSAGRPGDKVGPVSVGPAGAQALAFHKDGRYIDVIVRDPVADPRRYRAEFKAHGLNITLRLLPVSPSLVGTVVYFDGSNEITALTAIGKCWTGGGGNICPVGVRVPLGYRGQVNLVFGRAARPGEQYESTAPATARGEVMYGMRFRGQTVAEVLAALRKRHVTVPVFHYDTTRGTGELLRPSKVPGTWFVYHADPWAPQQVMLWVGPTKHEVTPNAGTPVPGPTPTPSATARA